MDVHDLRRLTAVSAVDKIEIYREGGHAPIVTQQAKANKRPYIHPIVAPDGAGVLTENSPSHHPWQHGLYTGLNRINGFGFWEEGIRGNPLDGTFHPLPLAPALVSGDTASWKVVTVWRAPDQSPLILEEQAWRFTDQLSTFVFALCWSLTARTDLEFGQHDYGGLFLRMPYRQERGGCTLNSEGQRNQDADGQRARWNAVSMPIEGRYGQWAGMAIMDHPANPEHPVPWRVDRKLGIVPSRCISGSWSLAQEKSQSFLHRIVVFCGEPDPEALERFWQSFAC
jgi:hypothetical protein